MFRLLASLFALGVSSAIVWGNPPATPLPPPLAAQAPSVDESQTLAGSLRGILLANLPTPLVDSNIGWDHQRNSTVGLKWHSLKPERQRSMQNDGLWQKVRLDAINPKESLTVGVRDLKHPEAGKTTFEAVLGMDVRLIHDQQLWKSGYLFYSGTGQGRCHATVVLKCEVTSRLEPKPNALLPDAIVRLRVVDAQFFYTNLVCEHLLGVGGSMAEQLGTLGHHLLNQLQPSFERQLLAQANSAIVKAADTKELRIELNKLFTVPGVSVK